MVDPEFWLPLTLVEVATAVVAAANIVVVVENVVSMIGFVDEVFVVEVDAVERVKSMAPLTLSKSAILCPSRACANNCAGFNTKTTAAAKMAMMAITIRSSIRVKPFDID